MKGSNSHTSSARSFGNVQSRGLFFQLVLSSFFFFDKVSIDRLSIIPSYLAK